GQDRISGRYRDLRFRGNGRGRKAGRGPARRDLPSGGDRLRGGRTRFRQGLSHQPRRHRLLDAIRLVGGGYKPRIVFTSSIAVFGAPFPDAIGDEFFHTPLLSYGTQKAIDELLLADYTRRGFMDGIGIRLPTICIRPGLPNK